MKNSNKKGFTLVELLVVIAILAILATVAVVGYTSFTEKAYESNDRSLVAQLNTAITKVDGKYETFHEVVEALDAQGFDVTEIAATSKTYEILWDMDTQEFFYTADVEKSGANIWIIADEVHATNSTYYTGSAASIETTLSFDAGRTGVSVVYNGTGAAIIHTNGGSLTVNSGSVTHYGAGYILTLAENVKYIECGSFAANANDIVNAGESNSEYVYVATADELRTALANESAKIALSNDITIEADPSVGHDFTIKYSVEINLNGYDIISAHNSSVGSSSVNNGVFYLEKTGALTLTGEGEVTFVTNSQMGWNNYSAVISGRGDVTIDGAIKVANLGGTDMSYAIDVHSWGDAESVNITIKSGYIYSAEYNAIRLNKQGGAADPTTTFNLVVEGGVVEGTHALMTHDGSADADGIYNITLNGGTLISTTSSNLVKNMLSLAEFTVVNNGATIITK